jgi:hypothetical protein
MTDRRHDEPDDPNAPPSAEELAAADELRLALDNPSLENADAELARSLRHASSPRPLDELSHRRILDRALGRDARRGGLFKRTEVVFALAAAAALVVAMISLRRNNEAPSAARSSGMIAPHSTEPLFTEPFAREGETSKRLDTIVASRGRDLRNNRYARWGVK